MKKPKLIRCEIRWNKNWLMWDYQEWAGRRVVVYTYHRNKPSLLRFVIAGLKRRVKDGAYGFSLRIRNKRGEYVSERTYPRSADPKKSKG